MRTGLLSALGALVALGVGGSACSSSSQPPCLASGQYQLTLTMQDEAGVAGCDGYAGSTALVSLMNLHAASPGQSTGSATIDVTRSPGGPPEVWSQCSKSDFISCQQVEVICTQATNDLVIYLSNMADGPGWAQFAAGHGAQCYENYSITVVGRPN